MPINCACQAAIAVITALAIDRHNAVMINNVLVVRDCTMLKLWRVRALCMHIR